MQSIIYSCHLRIMARFIDRFIFVLCFFHYLFSSKFCFSQSICCVFCIFHYAEWKRSQPNYSNKISAEKLLNTKITIYYWQFFFTKNHQFPWWSQNMEYGVQYFFCNCILVYVCKVIISARIIVFLGLKIDNFFRKNKAFRKQYLTHKIRVSCRASIKTSDQQAI